MDDSGIYALLIHCPGCRIRVGALGELEFAAGYYVYIGSAQRNMNQRIERHKRREKKMRWHIDYLLQCARIVDVHSVVAPKECEEWVARKLAETHKFVKGFGASDSHAPSHLFYGPKEHLWNDVISVMKRCKR